jgi:outer membrane immunogenic protein
MNTKFFEISAIIGTVLIAAPALADEAPAVAKPVRHRQVERAPAQAPARTAPERTAAAQPSWTGAQVGGQGGVSPTAQGFAEPGARLFPDCVGIPAYRSYCTETPFSFSGNKTSATGGGFLGYRIQFGTWVGGIEGDINAKSASASYSQSGSNLFRSETFTGTASQGADGSIRGRLGYLVTPWTMVYGTGGVAFGKVSGSFAYNAREIDGAGSLGGAYATGGGSWSTTRTGATGGGGVETLIFPNLTLRLEYRYTDLGSFSENVGLHTFCDTTCRSPSSNAVINLHPTFQTVTVGVGYNF